jgi:hypothetical protein
MAEEQENVEETSEEEADAEEQEAAEEEAKKNEQRVMCYISKRMVPISDTVEVVYSQTKKYRVLPEFIKY